MFTILRRWQLSNFQPAHKYSGAQTIATEKNCPRLGLGFTLGLGGGQFSAEGIVLEPNTPYNRTIKRQAGYFLSR